MAHIETIPGQGPRPEFYYSDAKTKETNYPAGAYCDLETRRVYLEGQKEREDFHARIAELNNQNRFSEILLDEIIEEVRVNGEVDLGKLESVIRRHERGLNTSLWIAALGSNDKSPGELLDIWSDVERFRDQLGEKTPGHTEIEAEIFDNPEAS
ncbi:MAG: hypothetical protein HYT09_03730 [Candidatus Levybacteria bacterium]|nr:hypothetical protein [Candidatus Levybacteria bacterium]